MSNVELRIKINTDLYSSNEQGVRMNIEQIREWHAKMLAKSLPLLTNGNLRGVCLNGSILLEAHSWEEVEPHISAIQGQLENGIGLDRVILEEIVNSNHSVSGGSEEDDFLETSDGVGWKFDPNDGEGFSILD